MNTLKDIITPKLILLFFLITFTLTAKICFSSFKTMFIIILAISFALTIFSIISKNFELVMLTVIFVFIFILFYIRLIYIQYNYNKIINNFENIQESIGYINSHPVYKNNKLEFKVKIIRIKYKKRVDFTQIKSFTILLKVKDPEDISPQQGDLLQIKNIIKKPREKIFNFKYRDYLYNKKIYGIVNTKKDEINIINNRKVVPFFVKILKRGVWNFRKKIISKIKDAFSSKVASFLLSIFLGLRNEIDEDLYGQFRNTGMVHLLAISGLHIGFIGMLFFKIFNSFLSKSKSLLISIIFLLFYIILIIPSASSARAFIMYCTCAVYFISGMKTIGINNLSIAAMILMFINPYMVFDLGFQFSFLATAGIILLSGTINEKLPYFIHYKIKSIISVTLSAFSSILCLQWSIFGEVALFSVLSSILVVPLFGYYFALTFILLIFLITTNLNIFPNLIKICSIAFLKLINILNIIPPIRLPSIPRYIAYTALPVLVIYFYVFDKKIIEIIKNKKIDKIQKTLSISLKKLE